jgi:hypothetical protein
MQVACCSDLEVVALLDLKEGLRVDRPDAGVVKGGDLASVRYGQCMPVHALICRPCTGRVGGDKPSRAVAEWSPDVQLPEGANKRR